MHSPSLVKSWDILFERWSEKAKQEGRRLKQSEMKEIFLDTMSERFTATGIPKLKKGEFSDEVEQIWEAYPKHSAPAQGKTAIMKALERREFGYLIERTRAYASYVKSYPPEYRYGADGRDKVSYAQGWFNGDRFDEPEKEWAYRGRVQKPSHGVESALPEPPSGWTFRFCGDYPNFEPDGNNSVKNKETGERWSWKKICSYHKDIAQKYA